MSWFTGSSLMSATESAKHLDRYSGTSKNWIYGLQDNRRRRHLMEIGPIPYTVVNQKVFYKKADIKAVAHELLLSKLLKNRPNRLF
jgi:hypothetical protein